MASNKYQLYTQLNFKMVGVDESIRTAMESISKLDAKIKEHQNKAAEMRRKNTEYNKGVDKEDRINLKKDADYIALQAEIDRLKKLKTQAEMDMRDQKAFNYLKEVLQDAENMTARTATRIRKEFPKIMQAINENTPGAQEKISMFAETLRKAGVKTEQVMAGFNRMDVPFNKIAGETRGQSEAFIKTVDKFGRSLVETDRQYTIMMQHYADSKENLAIIDGQVKKSTNARREYIDVLKAQKAEQEKLATITDEKAGGKAAGSETRMRAAGEIMKLNQAMYDEYREILSAPAKHSTAVVQEALKESKKLHDEMVQHHEKLMALNAGYQMFHQTLKDKNIEWVTEGEVRSAYNRISEINAFRQSEERKSEEYAAEAAQKRINENNYESEIAKKADDEIVKSLARKIAAENIELDVMQKRIDAYEKLQTMAKNGEIVIPEGYSNNAYQTAKAYAKENSTKDAKKAREKENADFDAAWQKSTDYINRTTVAVEGLSQAEKDALEAARGRQAAEKTASDEAAKAVTEKEEAINREKKAIEDAQKAELDRLESSKASAKTEAEKAQAEIEMKGKIAAADKLRDDAIAKRDAAEERILELEGKILEREQQIKSEVGQSAAAVDAVVQKQQAVAEKEKEILELKKQQGEAGATNNTQLEAEVSRLDRLYQKEKDKLDKMKPLSDAEYEKYSQTKYLGEDKIEGWKKQLTEIEPKYLAFKSAVEGNPVVVKFDKSSTESEIREIGSSYRDQLKQWTDLSIEKSGLKLTSKEIGISDADIQKLEDKYRMVFNSIEYNTNDAFRKQINDMFDRDMNMLREAGGKFANNVMVHNGNVENGIKDQIDLKKDQQELINAFKNMEVNQFSEGMRKFDMRPYEQIAEYGKKYEQQWNTNTTKVQEYEKAVKALEDDKNRPYQEGIVKGIKEQLDQKKNELASAAPTVDLTPQIQKAESDLKGLKDAVRENLSQGAKDGLSALDGLVEKMAGSIGGGNMAKKVFEFKDSDKQELEQKVREVVKDLEQMLANPNLDNAMRQSLENKLSGLKTNLESNFNFMDKAGNQDVVNNYVARIKAAVDETAGYIQQKKTEFATFGTQTKLDNDPELKRLQEELAKEKGNFEAAKIAMKEQNEAISKAKEEYRKYGETVEEIEGKINAIKGDILRKQGQVDAAQAASLAELKTKSEETKKAMEDTKKEIEDLEAKMVGLRQMTRESAMESLGKATVNKKGNVIGYENLRGAEIERLDEWKKVFEDSKKQMQKDGQTDSDAYKETLAVLKLIGAEKDKQLAQNHMLVQDVKQNVEFYKEQLQNEQISKKQRGEYQHELKQNAEKLVQILNAPHLYHDDEIQMAVKLAKDLVGSTDLNVKAQEKLNRAIEAGNLHLADRKLIQDKQMSMQLMGVNSTTLNKAADGIVAGEKTIDDVTVKFRGLKDMTRECYEEQISFWEAVRVNAKSTKQDVAVADIALKNLKEGLRAKDEESVKGIRDRFASAYDANGRLDGTKVDLSGKNMDQIERDIQKLKAFRKHLEPTTEQTLINQIDQELVHLNGVLASTERKAAETKQAMLAKDGYNNLKGFNDGTKVLGEEEFKKSIALLEELRLKAQQDKNVLKELGEGVSLADLDKQIADATKKMEELKRKAKEDMKTAEYNSLYDQNAQKFADGVSNKKLEEMLNYWREMVKTTDQGNAKLQEYKDKVTAIGTQLKENATKAAGNIMGTQYKAGDIAGAANHQAQTNSLLDNMNVGQLKDIQTQIQTLLNAEGTGTSSKMKELKQDLQLVEEQLKRVDKSWMSVGDAQRMVGAIGNAGSLAGSDMKFTVENLERAKKALEEYGHTKLDASTQEYKDNAAQVKLLSNEIARLKKMESKDSTGSTKTGSGTILDPQVYKAVVDAAMKSKAAIENLYRTGFNGKDSDGNTTRIKVSLDEVKASLKQWRKEKENDANMTTREYEVQAAGMARLDKFQKELTNSTKAHSSTLENAIDRLKNYFMVYVGAQQIMDKVFGELRKNFELSDEMANVQKVTRMTTQEVKELSDQIVELDSRTSHSTLMQFAYQGGKMGISGAEELSAFAATANKLNMSLGEDFGGAQAIASLAKLNNVMHVAQKEGVSMTEGLTKTASAILELGNSSIASYQKISQFATRMGGIASSAHITMPQLLAMGSTLDTFGAQSEMAATAMTKFISTLAKQPEVVAKAVGASEDEMQKLVWNGQTMDAMQLVFDSLKKNGVELETVAGKLKDIVGGGNNTRALQVLTEMANGADTLRQHLKLSKDAFDENINVEEEYLRMNSTAQASLERIGNTITEAFANSETVGFFNSIMKGLADTVSGIENLKGRFGIFVVGAWMTIKFYSSRAYAHLAMHPVKLAALWLRNITSVKLAIASIGKMLANTGYFIAIQGAFLLIGKLYDLIMSKWNSAKEMHKDINSLYAEEEQKINHEINSFKAKLEELKQANASAAKSAQDAADKTVEAKEKEAKAAADAADAAKDAAKTQQDAASDSIKINKDALAAQKDSVAAQKEVEEAATDSLQAYNTMLLEQLKSIDIAELAANGQLDIASATTENIKQQSILGKVISGVSSLLVTQAQAQERYATAQLGMVKGSAERAAYEKQKAEFFKDREREERDANLQLEGLRTGVVKQLNSQTLRTLQESAQRDRWAQEYGGNTDLIYEKERRVREQKQVVLQGRSQDPRTYDDYGIANAYNEIVNSSVAPKMMSNWERVNQQMNKVILSSLDGVGILGEGGKKRLESITHDLNIDDVAKRYQKDLSRIWNGWKEPAKKAVKEMPKVMSELVAQSAKAQEQSAQNFQSFIQQNSDSMAQKAAAQAAKEAEQANKAKAEAAKVAADAVAESSAKESEAVVNNSNTHKENAEAVAQKPAAVAEATKATNDSTAATAANSSAVAENTDSVNAAASAAQDAAKASVELASATEDATAKTEEAKQATDENAKAVEEEKDMRQASREEIDLINQTYGDYLGFLLDETAKQYELADAISLVTAKRKADALQKSITDVETRAGEKYNEGIQEYKDKVYEDILGVVKDKTKSHSILARFEEFLEKNADKNWTKSNSTGSFGERYNEIIKWVSKNVEGASGSSKEAVEIRKQLATKLNSMNTKNLASKIKDKQDYIDYGTQQIQAKMNAENEKVRNLTSANIDKMEADVKALEKELAAAKKEKRDEDITKITVKLEQAQKKLSNYMDNNVDHFKNAAQIESNLAQLNKEENDARLALEAAKKKGDKKAIEQAQTLYDAAVASSKEYQKKTEGQRDEKAAKMYEKLNGTRDAEGKLVKDANGKYVNQGLISKTQEDIFQTRKAAGYDRFQNISTMKGDRVVEGQRALLKYWRQATIDKTDESLKTFGQRVGEKFSSFEDAKKWQEARLAEYRERAKELNITIEGAWASNKDKKDRQNQSMSKAALAELDRYYETQKTMYESMVAQKQISEEEGQRRIDQSEEEHLHKRAELQNTFTKMVFDAQTGEFRKMTDKELEDFRKWWAELAKEGNLEEITAAEWKEIDLEWVIDGVKLQGKELEAFKKKLEQARKANDLSAQKDMTKEQDIINKRNAKIEEALLKYKPMEKVLDDMRKNLDTIDVLFIAANTEVERTAKGAAEHHEAILQSFIGRIGSMTEEEYREEIAKYKEFAGITEKEAKLQYNTLLEVRDQYDEAARKQAKNDLKLMDNRMESGQWYEEMLERVKSEKLKVNSAARDTLVDYFSKRQNTTNDKGESVSYQKRQKEELSELEKTIKSEEALKNAGVQNDVRVAKLQFQLSQKNLKAAQETLLARKSMYSAEVAAYEKEIIDLKAAMEKAHGDELEAMKVQLGDLERERDKSRVKEQVAVEDAEKKKLECETEYMAKLMELTAKRGQSIKEYTNMVNDAILSIMSAGSAEAEAKKNEIALARYNEEIARASLVGTDFSRWANSELPQALQRSRYAIIQNGKVIRTEMLTPLEKLEEEQKIAAKNAKLDAYAKLIEDFGKKLSDDIDKALNEQVERMKQKRVKDEMAQDERNINQVTADMYETAFKSAEERIHAQRMADIEEYINKVKSLNGVTTISDSDAADQINSDAFDAYEQMQDAGRAFKIEMPVSTEVAATPASVPVSTGNADLDAATAKVASSVADWFESALQSGYAQMQENIETEESAPADIRTISTDEANKMTDLYGGDSVEGDILQVTDDGMGTLADSNSTLADSNNTLAASVDALTEKMLELYGENAMLGDDSELTFDEKLQNKVDAQASVQEKIRQMIKDTGKTQKDTDKDNLKSIQTTGKQQVSFTQRMTDALIQSANLYGVTYAAVTNQNLSTKEKAETAALGATGQVMNSLLSAALSECVAKIALHSAEGSAKAFGMNPYAAAAIIAVMTAALGVALGAAQNAVSKGKSEISSITGASGASAGKLATGMLTYAEGRDPLSPTDSSPSMGSGAAQSAYDAITYKPGSTYSVHGNDGVDYSAKFEGRNLSTGLRKGEHFGIFSEKQPEMVISGPTTQKLLNDYPGLYNQIMAIDRGQNPMAAIDFNYVMKQIEGMNLTRTMGMTNMAKGMPTFAVGTNPTGGEYVDMEDGSINNEQLTINNGSSANSQNAELNSTLGMLNAVLSQMMEQGVHSNIVMSGRNGLDEQQKKYERFKKRMGLN